MGCGVHAALVACGWAVLQNQHPTENLLQNQHPIEGLLHTLNN